MLCILLCLYFKMRTVLNCMFPQILLAFNSKQKTSTNFFLKYKHNRMQRIMFIAASQAKGIHQYKNVIKSLVRINILPFKISHSCGARNNVNNFLQKFNHFKGISHKAITAYTVTATDHQEQWGMNNHEKHYSANTGSNMTLSTLCYFLREHIFYFS